MKKLILILALSLLGASASITSVAIAKTEVIKLNTDQKSAVKRLNDYINSFTSLKGEFVQISPRGAQTRGVVMIDKPGKMRFEYAAPNQLLVVSDGKWLSITNKKRDRGDQFPVNSTPLRLVVSPSIDLLVETDILAFEQTDGLTSVALKDKRSKLGGYIVLVYDETNNVLQQWIVVDGKGQRTTTQLSKLVTGVKLDAKMFVSTIKRKN